MTDDEKLAFDLAVVTERKRQIENLGYDAKHDRDAGWNHLLDVAMDQIKKGKTIEAAAMLQALDLYKRGEEFEKAVAGEATTVINNFYTPRHGRGVPSWLDRFQTKVKSWLS